MEDKYYEVSQDTLDVIQEIISAMALPIGVKIKYVGSHPLKGVCKLQKMSPINQYITNTDLVLQINEQYFDLLGEVNSKILINQELDRIQIDINKGTIKIAKLGFQTSVGIINKYGLDAVAEANQITDLLTEQIKDGKKDEFDANSDAVKTKIKVKKDLEFLKD